MSITIICHDSERDRALRIAEPFVARGHKVSIASAGLRPDDEQWKSKSFNRFGNSSLILILLTKKSVVDKAVGWLVSQVLFEEGLPFVPVRLEDELPAQQSWKMPSEIYDHDWLAFAEDDADRLLAFIDDLLPPPASAAAAAMPEAGRQASAAAPAVGDPEAAATEPAAREGGGAGNAAGASAAAGPDRGDTALIARTATEGRERHRGTGDGWRSASPQPQRSRIWWMAAAAAMLLIFGSAFAFVLVDPGQAPAPRSRVADVKEPRDGPGLPEPRGRQGIDDAAATGAEAEPVDFEVAAGGETQRPAAVEPSRPSSAQRGDAADDSPAVRLDDAGPDVDGKPAVDPQADPQAEMSDDSGGDVIDTADEAQPDPVSAEPKQPTGVARRPDPAVVGVQRNLSVLGYAPGPVDGFTGPRTQRAIRAFQQRRGLTVTGRVTPQLVAALERAVRETTRRRQAGEDRRISDWRTSFGFGLDSVEEPEMFEEYCERNPETWIFDKGRGENVFCGRVAGNGR